MWISFPAISASRLAKVNLAFLFVLFSGSLSAAILDWNGLVDGDWSESGNWTGGSPRTDSSDSLTFSGTLNTSSNNDLAGPLLLIDEINFTNTGDGEGFALTGNSIQLQGDITTIAAAVGSIEDTIDINIELTAADLGINTGLGHNVRVNGNISGTERLNINNASLSADDGIVTLTGSNTYTGGTRLRGGTLAIENDSALGTGTLELADASDTNPVFELSADGLNISNDIIVSNTGSIKTILLNTGSTASATLSGAIQLNETGGRNTRFIVGTNNSLTLSGNVSGQNLSLRREKGGGTLILSGNNTYGGTTFLEEGTLVIASNNALGVSTLRIEDRGVNPTVDILDAVQINNDIQINNRGSTKTIRVDQSGNIRATIGSTGTDNTTIYIAEKTVDRFLIRVGGGDRLTIHSDITGGGNAGIRKSGTGTLVMTGTNVNDGGIRVDRGTLLINGDQSAASGAVEVDKRATLGGSGVIGGNLIVDGTLAPGDEGIESFQAQSAELNTGSVFDYEINSSAPLSTSADLLFLEGGLNITNTVTLQITDRSPTPAALAIGTILSMIYYEGVLSGDVFTYEGTSLLEGTLFTQGLNTFRINYSAAGADLGGNFFSEQATGGKAITLTVVPEASNFSLLLAAFSLLGVLTNRSLFIRRQNRT